MGAECAETDRQQTKSGCDPEKCNRHWPYSIIAVSAIVTSLAAEKFAKRLKDTVWECSSFLPEILQFLRELGLCAAVNFTNDLRNLVVGQRDFIRGPGRVA